VFLRRSKIAAKLKIIIFTNDTYRLKIQLFNARHLTLEVYFCMLQVSQKNMDCVNIRLNGEQIQFDCPNCGIDAEINEDTLHEIWSNFEGMVTCPLPNGCNSFIKIPSKEQIQKLRHTSVTTRGEIADNNERQIEEEAEKNEGKTEEKNNEPPSGPFRYVSKSDEASAWAEDFENKKSSKTVKPTTSPLAIRTFRNKDCIVQGQNHFDETVSSFLGNIGKDNVICVSPINYTDPQDKSPDYGVVVYYQNSIRKNSSSKEPSEQPEASPAAEPVVWRD